MHTLNEHTVLQDLKRYPILGKGAFTTCRAIDAQTVALITVDPLKEVYSMGWLGDMFPKLDKVKALDHVRTLYTCKRYPRQRGITKLLDPDQKALYDKLRKVYVEHYRPARSGWDNLANIRSVFGEHLTDDMQEQLIDACDNLANYTDQVGFEVSPRNIAVDNGKLVLLDLFFDTNALRKVYSGTLPQSGGLRYITD